MLQKIQVENKRISVFTDVASRYKAESLNRVSSCSHILILSSVRRRVALILRGFLLPKFSEIKYHFGAEFHTQSNKQSNEIHTFSQIFLPCVCVNKLTHILFVFFFRRWFLSMVEIIVRIVQIQFICTVHARATNRSTEKTRQISCFCVSEF